MTLDITGKNLDITPAIRERIEFKFKKLEKYQVPFIGKHAVISTEPNRQFKVEISAAIPGGQLVASAEHDDMYGAITEVYQKLERQLNKQAHKPTARRASHSDKPEIEEVDAAEETEA
ncbi:ribosome hibernation-promoting factor, HPF/YfiA family [Photobacterium aphoticum]|uniref:Cold-shock protein n=1 Tax=Photobacterium aphoticum TaxID=754436 RepID=A0A090R2J2_9GAMM|nr:ribosome-associated translation inhibitor RaiA [Photobacterium aphoticum]KLU99028.1 cold-shock protein [Photobacterium aphoticum]PSU55643.1 ribosome-associated translation inhibitor RaiA [Photobacterium aphoticum]GAL08733.1 ribosome hibernation protein YfiA [Photobacterium aphoticum]GHA57513.1 ribosomal subunit interface protein [Photobacterium aphoticum]